MKTSVLHLSQMSQSQWMFCNITLYDKHRGYLCLHQLATTLKEAEQLLDISLDIMPNN
jgi:hypothetical protein